MKENMRNMYSNVRYFSCRFILKILFYVKALLSKLPKKLEK